MTLDFDFMPVADAKAISESCFLLDIMKGNRPTHALASPLTASMVAYHLRFLYPGYENGVKPCDVSMVKLHYSIDPKGKIRVEAVAMDDIKAFDKETLGYWVDTV